MKSLKKDEKAQMQHEKQSHVERVMLEREFGLLLHSRTRIRPFFQSLTDGSNFSGAQRDPVEFLKFHESERERK